MATPDGQQFYQNIPQEHHDWAWEVLLVPENDQEYVRKDGSPQLLPGHLHFDEGGNLHHASGMCAGRHDCPQITKRWRYRLALEKWQQTRSNE